MGRGSAGNVATVALWGSLGRFEELGTFVEFTVGSDGCFRETLFVLWTDSDESFWRGSEEDNRASSGERLVLDVDRLGLDGLEEGRGGRGEMGTFQMTASSGTSSSESWYSSSSSLMVLRGCSDDLRAKLRWLLTKLLAAEPTDRGERGERGERELPTLDPW